MSSLRLTHNEFVNKWLGKRIDFDGDGSYQCTDLAREYVESVWGLQSYAFYYKGTDLSKGGAADAYEDFNHSLVRDSRVTRIPNGILKWPKQGDIIVFKRTSILPNQPGFYGHIAIVNSANILSVTSIDQNTGTANGDGLGDNAIRFRTRSYSQVLGWLTLDINNNEMTLPSLVIPETLKPRLVSMVQSQRNDIADVLTWLPISGIYIVFYNLGTHGRQDVVDAAISGKFNGQDFNIWPWVLDYGSKEPYAIFGQYAQITTQPSGYDINGIRANAQNILDKTK